MRKLLKPLYPGRCDNCSRRTLVRRRHRLERQISLHVCVTCVPVDRHDMIYESSKLVLAGYGESGTVFE